uniref:Uncharacterized protein n=1 Tax=Utricularia reniformis TaxID=192314 RepID=A0A1Y0B4P9_9LAMI|nr:hypothetical protein AEK19_MT2227 [Utricularia reniformis]ART32373.1 hypothetical protein AEK19_MT2227 [Utricularia reniformis]
MIIPFKKCTYSIGPSTCLSTVECYLFSLMSIIIPYWRKRVKKEKALYRIN